MLKKITTLLTVLFFVSIGFTQVFAQTDKEEIRQMLDQRNEEIKTLLGAEGTEYTQEQRQQLKNIINEVIDYRSMAKYALQDTWNTLDAQERQNFVDLFSKIVRDHSLTNLDIY